MGVPSRWVVTVELRKGLNPAPGVRSLWHCNDMFGISVIYPQ